MKKLLILCAALVSLTVAAFGQSNTAPSVVSNQVATTGPVTVIAGTAVGTGLTWIAQHGSAGAEYCGPMIGGKNGGTGPAVTETAWFLDMPWVSGTVTNIDFKTGLLHSDVVAKTITVDQFGLELDEAFFNENLVNTTAKWPVIGNVVKALAHLDIEVTESAAENTDVISKARFSDEKMDWGVGVKIVKLY